MEKLASGSRHKMIINIDININKVLININVNANIKMKASFSLLLGAIVLIGMKYEL